VFKELLGRLYWKW